MVTPRKKSLTSRPPKPPGPGSFRLSSENVEVCYICLAIVNEMIESGILMETTISGDFGYGKSDIVAIMDKIKGSSK